MGAATIAELRTWGREQLRSFPSAALETDVLLAAALRLDALAITIRSAELVTDSDRSEFVKLIARRRQHEPIAYLLGRKEFYSREFIVSPAVLVPRPETELLIDQALKHFSCDTAAFDLIDVGTGSGNIIVTISAELRKRFGSELIERGRFFGFDLSDAALEVAARNAQTLGERQIELLNSDLLSELPPLRSGTSLRLVVSNPPYIPDSDQLDRDVVDYEPHQALFSGPRGLDHITRLVGQWRTSSETAEREVLVFEIGYEQQTDVESVLAAVGAPKPLVIKDFQGIPRIVEAEFERQYAW